MTSEKYKFGIDTLEDDTVEYFAVDTDSLKEYILTKEEYENRRISDKDPSGKPRWEWKRWK